MHPKNLATRVLAHSGLVTCILVTVACSHGNDELNVAVANQYVKSTSPVATGGTSGSISGVVQGRNGMEAYPAGWQRNPKQCQPSVVPPAKKTCFDASASSGLNYCDSCSYDSHCSGANGSCIENAADASSSVPILGCSGKQTDATVRYPCLDSGDVVHIPLCNRGHDAITNLVWIGIYSGASNIPSCAQAGNVPDKGQVSYDASGPGAIQPGQCVDVHFSRTSATVDGNIHDKLDWSVSSLPNGNPQRAILANWNASVHECDFCNNWAVFSGDQCGDSSASSSTGGGGASSTASAGNGSMATAGTDAVLPSAGGTSPRITGGGGASSTDSSGNGSLATGGTDGDLPPSSTVADVVTATVGVADSDGQPVLLNEATTTVSVETRSPNGDWLPVEEVVAGFGVKAPVDVVIVADNSGSEVGRLAEMSGAIQNFADDVLAANPLNRVGLVRVSTTAKVLLPLTDDSNAVTEVLSRLAVKNGWTALFDGIALGNQTLEAGKTRPLNSGAFCYAGPYRSIVVFTDGKENNSHGQKLDVPDRTLDTSLLDLANLDVEGMRTAIYTVGIGKHIDEATLAAFANGSGGRFAHIADYAALESALLTAAAQLETQLPVCFSPNTCGDVEARVVVTVRRASGDSTGERTIRLPKLCNQ